MRQEVIVMRVTGDNNHIPQFIGCWAWVIQTIANFAGIIFVESARAGHAVDDWQHAKGMYQRTPGCDLKAILR